MPAVTKSKKHARRIDYSNPRWQIVEVHSKFRAPIRVSALSSDQAKFKARRKAGVDWLEVTDLFVVDMFHIVYEIDGAIVETVASGINETDARFYLAKRLKGLSPQLPHVISIERLSTLWEYNRSKGKSPDDLYAPGEESLFTNAVSAVP